MSVCECVHKIMYAFNSIMTVLCNKYVLLAFMHTYELGILLSGKHGHDVFSLFLQRQKIIIFFYAFALLIFIK